MRFSSSGEVVRTDLRNVHRLVPAAWDEWCNLRFDPDGHVLHPDDGRVFPDLKVRLIEGRHREPGARYGLDPDVPGPPITFTLTHDDRRTLRGTLAGEHWSVDLALGAQCTANGTADVAAMAGQDDRWVARIVGRTPATGELQADLTAFEGRRLTSADLGRASASMQRASGRATVGLRTKSTTWNAHLVLSLRGRGLLGRAALLFGRSFVRRGLQEAMAQFWTDLGTQAQEFRTEVEGLDAKFTAAGGPAAWLHRELWTVGNHTG